MLALVQDGAVVALSENAEVLAALGPGDVLPVPPALLPAVAAGWRLGLEAGELVEDLDGAKARLWEAAKARRAAAERAGCETPLGRVDTDLESVQRISGGVTAAQLALAQGQAFAIDWTMEDNSVATHDAPAMIAMGLAAMAHVAACHQRGREIRDAIQAAETLAELGTIDLDAGWP